MTQAHGLRTILHCRECHIYYSESFATPRKVCGGFRSMAGLDNTAALLTVIQTCKAQGRSVLDFFCQALIDPSSLSLIPILT